MELTTSATAFTEIYLPALSVFGVALLLAVLLPLAIVAGFLFGAARRRRLLESGRPVDTVVGEATGGVILALLGLLLAFAFGYALNLSHDRKTTLTEEAAALGTAFLRADYLADPGRTKLKTALYDYATTRIIPGGRRLDSLEKAQAFLDTSLKAQARLWPLTLEATADPLPDVTKFFIASAITEVMDAHLRRMQGLSAPVSDFTQAMILATALVGLFVLGNRAGMLGRRLSWRTFTLGSLLFFVMVTIIDTQQNSDGLIRLDSAPLRATIMEMEIALGQKR